MNTIRAPQSPGKAAASLHRALRKPQCLAFLAAACSALAAHAETPIALPQGIDIAVRSASWLSGAEPHSSEQAALAIQPYPRAGWQATLSRFAHNVGGTVTIVDADTFRVDNFFYDGGGINVHFILAAANDNNSFRSTGLVTDLNLLGTPHNGDSLTIDLPAGTSFDGYNAISLWCIPAQANFGSGAFLSPVPEPTSLVLTALGTFVLVLRTRRRPRPLNGPTAVPSGS